MTPGERLRHWRMKRGLSQRAAAELAGISQTSWSHYENGQKRPRVAQALRLAVLTRRDRTYRVTVEMFGVV